MSSASGTSASTSPWPAQRETPPSFQVMRDLLRKLAIAWDMEHDVDLGTDMHETDDRGADDETQKQSTP